MKNAQYQFIAINGKAVEVVKESEKAVQLNISLWSQNGHSCIHGNEWFPKSVISEKDGKWFVAAWFANKSSYDFSKKFKPGFDWANIQGLNF
jgi:hypothetical protein